MDEAHRKDSHTERLCRDAVRAIEAVLADENRKGQKKSTLLMARGELKDLADHIVAAWD